MYDLIIIGAGPAGITASVYAARKRINFLVLTKDIGGQASWSGDIENYTGYQFITGPELTEKFLEHIKKHKIQVNEGEGVLEVSKQNDDIFVKSKKEVYKSKTLIIASGKRSKELNVEGEKEFKNKGVTYCATCDGPLFQGKDVAVIGGGNSALDAALQLIKIAKHTYIINITESLTGDEVMREKVEKSKVVDIYNNTKVKSIYGDSFVKGLEIDRKGKSEKLNVSGIFIEIGLIPNSEFAKTIEKNNLGEIKVDNYNRTNVEGIFACGDVTDVPEKQIIIAAGEGAKASLSAIRYLNTKR